METQFERYIPADADFVKHVEAAFAKERAIYDTNTEVMREIAAFAEPGQHAQPVNEDGEEVEVYTPEYMVRMGQKIDEFWLETQQMLKAAHSAQEQGGAMFQLMQETFATTAYSGTSPLMMRFFDALVRDVAEHYEEETPGNTIKPESQPLPHVGGATPHRYFEGLTQDLISYSSLCDEALDDIGDLTELHQANLGLTGAEAALTPYDITLKRYCASRKIDPELLDSVPPEHQEQFLKKQAKLYAGELFGPFSDILPQGGASPEMAWFIGAAVSAVRIEETEAFLGQKKRAQVHTVKPTQSYVDRVLRSGYTPPPMRPLADPANDMSREPVAILSDPKSQARMHEMLAEIFEDFPDMARNPAELLAAKDQFIATYFEAPAKEMPSQGR